MVHKRFRTRVADGGTVAGLHPNRSGRSPLERRNSAEGIRPCASASAPRSQSCEEAPEDCGETVRDFLSCGRRADGRGAARV